MDKIYVLGQVYNVGIEAKWIAEQQFNTSYVEVIGVFDNVTMVLKAANDFGHEIIGSQYKLDNYLNDRKDELDGRESSSETYSWTDLTEEDLDEPVVIKAVMDTFIGSEAVATTSIMIKTCNLNEMITESNLGKTPF